MWIDSFLKYIRYEKNYSSHTVLSYRRDLLQFQNYLSGIEEPVSIEAAQRDQVRNWVALLVEGGDTSRTVARKVSALRTFYTYLIRQKVIRTTPMRDVSVPKIDKPLPVFVRPSEMNTLLDEEVPANDFAALRDRLILLMLYMTGMRRAELISLRDVDVDTRSLQLKVTGKRNKQRIIPFGVELGAAIEEYRRVRKVSVGSVSPYFLVKDDGEPLYPMYVYRLVTRKLGEVTTLSRKSPHVLRHTFASAMLNNGAGLNSVKELLGHQSLASTQVYTHITFEELKQDYQHAHPRAEKKKS
ncbi:MAG: tyrosine-type recombinase/integrase [Porphyromonadaceae bacterium]|nr:tyrosine-type recombinase/integrase [Porphyromonadaceae bacterium]